MKTISIDHTTIISNHSKRLMSHKYHIVPPWWDACCCMWKVKLANRTTIICISEIDIYEL